MDQIAKIAGSLVFVCAIAANFLLGVHASVRLVVFSCMIGGVHALLTRKVPVAWKGQSPSTHLRGTAAVIFGLFLSGVGVLMVFFASLATCLLGWALGC